MSFLLFTSNTFLDAIFGRTYGCNHEGIYSFNYIWICRYEHFIRRQYWLHLYLSISLSGFWLPLWYFQTLLPAIFVFNYFASFHIFVSQNVSLLFYLTLLFFCHVHEKSGCAKIIVAKNGWVLLITRKTIDLNNKLTFWLTKIWKEAK
jgi:hypothetical protein